MSESQGRDLKPPVDGMFYDNFGFGTFFRYHNFQNEIDAWESTVRYSRLKAPDDAILFTVSRITAIADKYWRF